MHSLPWKRLLANLYLAPSTASRKVILLYHSIGNTPWAMDIQQFTQQMCFLQKHCEVMTLSALLRAKPSDKIQVAITFDDGYACIHDIAAPIMKEYHIPGMVYLNTNWIAENGSDRMLSQATLGHYPEESFLAWPEVESLFQQGWEFGSHGMNHLHFKDETAAVVIQELKLSRRSIEQHVQQSCRHFAYTWGEYNARLQKIVKDIGYDYAVAAIHGRLRANSDPLALPRINISRDYTIDDFKNCILGKWDFLNYIQRIKRLI